MSNNEKVFNVLRNSRRMLSVGEIKDALKPDDLHRQSIYNSLNQLFKEGRLERSHDFSQGPPRSVWGINTNSPERIHFEYSMECARLSSAEIFGRIILARSIADVMKPLWHAQTSSILNLMESRENVRIG